MLRSTLFAALAGASMCAGASAQAVDTTRVITGVTRPVFVTAPPGDFNRVFVVEQRGIPAATSARIMGFQITPSGPYTANGAFLTITGVTAGNEQGLLGMAFHPDYLNNGYFWVNYTNSAGTTIIARYQANAPYATSNTANPAGTIILSIAQPFVNHNGGWIGFGPDGYLYIAMGDGGSANDPGNRAQNVNELLGKMLRIDVDGADNIPGNDDDDGIPGTSTPLQYTSPPDNPYAGAIAGRDEIWAIGLRNSWRNAFDRQTNRLFIGDVGQNAIEEIDVAPDNLPGVNYGWRCMEGFSGTGLTGCTCNGAGLRLPVQTYPHSGGACSLTGGYVYRGSAIPALQGTYFYADYCSNQIFSFFYTGDGTTPAPTPTNQTANLAPGGGLSIATITSFGEDAAGEMYICDQAGEVFKLIPPPPSNNSCVNATALTEAVPTSFSTVSATTDGPNEPTSCDVNGYTQIGNDVWFTITASCTGTMRVSLCGSAFNTKLAVYPNICPTVEAAIACNDDFCDLQSELTFAGTLGDTYRIRVGGYQGAVGTGTILVTCAPAPACVADVAGDNGEVDIDDLLAVISAWGPCPKLEKCPLDVVPNGVIDIDDLLLIISAWGPCPV